MTMNRYIVRYTYTMLMTQVVNKNSLQASMNLMKLSLLIVSLQLAQLATADDRSSHSDNVGLRRRQITGVTRSNLQAGQVQEVGIVQLSRSRARLGSSLPDTDIEQKDRREENDAVLPEREESGKGVLIGVRKGVRKAAKKGRKDTKRLLKQQILNRIVISEPVPVVKVSDFVRYMRKVILVNIAGGDKWFRTSACKENIKEEKRGP
jgi:hypothetical protein